jgi:hypothetical protein
MLRNVIRAYPKNPFGVCYIIVLKWGYSERIGSYLGGNEDYG